MISNDAPYKQKQRAAKASKNRVYQIWTSCEVVSSMLGKLVKISIEGTKRSRHLSSRIRGKAAINAAKRISHMKLFYRFQNAD